MEPHACLDPEDLEFVVAGIVANAPESPEKEHVGRVMTYYQGKVNPKVVVDNVRRVRSQLLPKMLAGHTADCAMDGCPSIPSCQSSSREVLMLKKRLGVTTLALQKIKTEWLPGRQRLSSCDPFTVADTALKVIK